MVHIPFESKMQDNPVRTRSLRSWLWLLPASFTEVAWISGVKSSSTALEWFGTTIAVVLSVWLALKSTHYMSATTVYIIFVALGTIGTFVMNITVYGASFTPVQIVLLGVLLIGISGLKSTSPA